MHSRTAGLLKTLVELDNGHELPLGLRVEAYVVSKASNWDELKGENMALPNNTQVRQDDAQLVPRALRGDAEALEALFARHNQALYQTALKVAGNPADAEDALQDGLLSAYRNLPRFEGRSQFSTWLTRIVINAALMRRRSQRARPAVSLDEPPREDEAPFAERFADAGPSPEQWYAGRELGAMVEEDLAMLSPLLRSAFLLREIEGLSTGEAARELGVSENTLKARLWRARQELAQRLEERLHSGTPGAIESAGSSLAVERVRAAS